MMKKSFLFTVAVVVATFVSCKKEVSVIPATVSGEVSASSVNTRINDDLPVNILDFVNEYYDQNDITSYEIKNIPVIGKSYELKFNHGTEIDLDEEGVRYEWIDPQGLPEGILPEKIINYLKKHYTNTFATSVDKEKTKIKVDLASGLDLEFDSNGNFIRIDD